MEALFEKIRKYNTWDSKLSDTGYQRQTYLERIKSFMGNKLIKVMVGQRRTGKSYILRQLINHLITELKVEPANVFYLNKEFLAFDEIQTAGDLEQLFQYYKTKIQPKGKIRIFLDEVQNIAGWEKFVNSYAQDFTEEYELFITGSNSKLLSGDLASLLSGRFVEFEIFPFSPEEMAEVKKCTINREFFIDYMKTGGLPETINFNNEELCRHYVDDLKNTIILRDIVQRHQVNDPMLLEDIFRFLATNTGNLTSIAGIVNYFKSKQRKTNYETLSTYIGYLQDTFLIHVAERYNLRGKQTLGGVRKYYLNDPAFRSYFFGFYPQDSGYYLENYVFVQLKRLGYKVYVGVLNGHEIDFVAQKADKTVYYQVAYLLNEPATIEREFGNLLAIKDNYEKVVISLDEISFSDYQGIRHIRPWELIG
jgi:predicted AAA+ superfamily ATPase